MEFYFSNELKKIIFVCYRAVIVAGGTMQPMSEFRVQLFECAGAAPERVTEFSCGHVVPPQNILPLIVPTGPSSLQFDFSYRSRYKTEMVFLFIYSFNIIIICLC